MDLKQFCVISLASKVTGPYFLRFFWGVCIDSVYIPLLPTTDVELKNTIRTAIGSITQDIVAKMWEEFEYRIDIAVHLEHLK